MLDVAIIGGGISGLYLAQLLSQTQINFAVFEARERFGGRILSHTHQHTADLGPTWVWPDEQPRLARFIASNSIQTKAQWQTGRSLYQTDRKAAPQSFIDESTYATAKKVLGGNQQLIQTILNQLDGAHLHSRCVLEKLSDEDEHIVLELKDEKETRQIKARQVVLAMPPRLITSQIAFSPALSTPLQQVMQNTPTWMAAHAKAIIYYQTPFWRKQGLSGNAYCQYQGAALMEIYDDTDSANGIAALSGFFGLPAALRRHYKHDLPALVTEQLTRLFGAEAAQPLHIEIKDWFDEPFTATEWDEIPPNSHPQYGEHALQLDHWNDKLFFCGTETAKQFGGYIEGALEAAERVANALFISNQSKNVRTENAATTV